jgi:hypothetical protein
LLLHRPLVLSQQFGPAPSLQPATLDIHKDLHFPSLKRSSGNRPPRQFWISLRKRLNITSRSISSSQFTKSLSAEDAAGFEKKAGAPPKISAPAR